MFERRSYRRGSSEEDEEMKPMNMDESALLFSIRPFCTHLLRLSDHQRRDAAAWLHGRSRRLSLMFGPIRRRDWFWTEGGNQYSGYRHATKGETGPLSGPPKSTGTSWSCTLHSCTLRVQFRNIFQYQAPESD